MNSWSGVFYARLTEVARFLHIDTSVFLLASAVAQLATFVLIGRGLGANIFGEFMLFLAVSQLAGEVVSLGSGEALIRKVVSDAVNHRAALGHALLLTFLTGVPLAAAVSVAVFFLQPSLAIYSIALFMLGELIGNRLTALMEHVYLAHGQIARANAVQVVPALAKLAVVVVGIYGLEIRDLETWLIVRGLTTLIGGTIVFAVVAARWGWPLIALDLTDLRFGTLVTVTHLARSAQFSVDRLVLGAYASPAMVAAYSSATRAIQFGFLPVLGILRNLFGQFFAAGSAGAASARRFAHANFWRVVLVGGLSGAALLAVSGFYAAVLGEGYADTAPILRWMTLLPLLQGVQFLLADALTGSNRQASRSAIEVVGTIAFVAFIAVATYVYGVAGLVAGLYFYQAIMIAGFALVLSQAGRAQSEKSI